MPCGWDLNLNNRLFRGDFAIFQSPGLPFFHLFQKNICKLFMSKTRIVEYFSAVLFFYFQERRYMSISIIMIFILPTSGVAEYY